MTPAATVATAIAATAWIWRGLTAPQAYGPFAVGVSAPVARHPCAGAKEHRPVLSSLALCSLLALATVTDLERRRIPNRALALGVGAALALGAAGVPPPLPERLLAATAGTVALSPVALARPEALGVGDVKL